MTKIVEIRKDVEIPDDITVTIDNKVITVEGEPLVDGKKTKRKLTKSFEHFDVVDITKEENIMVFTSYFVDRYKKSLTLNAAGVFENMIKGVREGYIYKSKIAYSHFPITVEPDLKKKEIVVKNLYGGRKPLKVKITGDDTVVSVEGDDVIITGIDKEAVGQTAANMKEICRLRGKRKKDPEAFIDGIWPFEKS